MLASQVTHWRTLTTYVGIAGIPLLAICMLLPESPRWLQGKGKIREALLVLRGIADGNGRKIDERHLNANSEKSSSEDKTQF